MAIRNLEAVKRRLAQIPAKVKTEIKKATEQNADEMVALAQNLAPRRTGALAASIRKQPGRTELATEVVADKFYARFVEFGTRSGSEGDTAEFSAKQTLSRGEEGQGRRRKVRRSHPGTRAQPFFFPAYRALKKRMKGRATRAANKAIKEAATS